MHNAVDVLRKKRNGSELSRDEIRWFVDAAVNDVVKDYQMSAFLMASFIRGLSVQETWWLTEAMRDSGECFSFYNDATLRTVDKHSTGGIGDKTSLIVAPIAASAGLAVPMIAGRGLGHTGGTVDKLAAIPGYRTHLENREFEQQVRDIGLAVVGQSERLCPADRLMYGLRDVTGTIDSIPLIGASIMSKKLAEGAGALVLDVKFGTGAFMKTRSAAEELARTLCRIAQDAGRRAVALVTKMDEPLGGAIGNALEVIESESILRGDSTPTAALEQLTNLSLDLAGAMLAMGGVVPSWRSGIERAEEILKSGAALQKWRQWMERQGGRSVETQVAPRAGVARARCDGVIAQMDVEDIGWLAVDLGAGRRRTEDELDLHCGFVSHCHLGQKVRAGDPLFEIFKDIDSLIIPIEAFIHKLEGTVHIQPDGETFTNLSISELGLPKVQRSGLIYSIWGVNDWNSE